MPKPKTTLKHPAIPALLFLFAGCAQTLPYRYFEYKPVYRSSFNVYGHESSSMEHRISPVTMPNGAKEPILFVNFDTGDVWGVNVGMANPRPTTSDGATNVKNATHVVLRAKISEGIKFVLLVDELGVGHGKSQRQRRTIRGSDGERWVSPDLVGTGDWEDYQVPLSEFSPSPHKDGWQNIAGNKRQDFQAVDNITIGFLGSQGKGMAGIHSVWFSGEAGIGKTGL